MCFGRLAKLAVKTCAFREWPISQVSQDRACSKDRESSRLYLGPRDIQEDSVPLGASARAAAVPRSRRRDCAAWASATSHLAAPVR